MDIEDADSTVMASVGEVLSAAINWVFVVFLAGINLLRALIALIPIILLFLLFGAIGVLIAYTHADIQEGVEQWRREYAVPTWQNSVRPIIDLFRIFINAIQCTFYGISWWTYGLVNDHLIPGLFAADVRPLAEAGFDFFTVFLEDLVIDYFIGFKFFDEPMDFTRIFDAWIVLWTEYQALVCYFCNSLCTLWSVQPVINPIPFATTFGVFGINVSMKIGAKIINALSQLITVGEASPPLEPPVLELPINVWDIPLLGWPINFFAFLGSDSIKDPETLCAIGSLFNAVGALLRVFSRMISQAILQQPVDRPDFNETVTFLCSFITCFVRSCENAFQRMIDAYIPIDFQFENFLCIIDSILCWALYSVDVILVILINIDRVVTYKGGSDGNTFYPDVVKPRVALVINLLGEPDKTDCDDRSCCSEFPLQPEYADINCYWMDPTDDRSLMWDPVRNQPRLRIPECICIFIERLLCDQSNTGMCFDEGIVGDFSFCCLTDAIFELIADLLAGFFELTLNFYSTDAIFRFIDRNKFVYFLKVNIVQLIDCIFSVFSLIPTVGPCLRIIFVRTFAVLLCLVEIIIRYVIALFTLPYFLVFNESSFVLDPARGAQAEWEAIIQGVTNTEDPTSLLNCLSFILNYGIPIPPIPCMECEPQGFIQPPPDIEIELGPPGSFENIMSLIKDDPSFGFYGQFTGLARLTPIRRYANETAVPWELRDMIAQNAPFLGNLIHANLASVDKKVDQTLKQIRQPKQYSHFTPAHVSDEGEWITLDGRMHSSGGGVNGTKDVKSVQSGLAPTKPPIVACTPTPPCFDLACYFRARVQFWGFLLEWFGRGWTALIQAGTTNFVYFTDGGFEADITLGIRLFVQRYVCLCDLLNLVIPVVGRWGGRPDFCCAIIRTADLVACILQTIINAIKSLALGKEDDFAYFKNGDFEKDLDVSFDITIEIIVCVCNLIRAVFPFLEANGFDVCCFPEVIITTVVEILRGVIFTILNLALLGTPKGKAYFQMDNPLTDDIDELPIVVRMDAAINALFGVDIPALNEASDAYSETTNDAFNIPDEYEPVCGQPAGGLPFCLCNLLDTLIPARPNPLEPVANDNCPFINLCCFPAEFFNFIAGFMRFGGRLLVTLWQPWEQQSDGRKQPIVFFNFLICDENAPVGHPEYTASCGKLDPVLDAATSFLAICPCEILQFVDYFIALIPIFSNWDCLCGNGIPVRPPTVTGQETGTNFVFPDPAIDVGIVPRLGFILRALLEVTLQTLLRRIPNPNFWANRDLIMSEVGEIPAMSLVELFFMPITDAICDFFVALSCIPANLLFWIDCGYPLERLFASVVAWAMEVFVRVLEFVEGIAIFFASFGPDDVPDTDENGDPIEDPSVTSGGTGNTVGNTIDTQTLTAAILNIVLLPLDILIADSSVDLPASRGGVPLATCPENRPVDGVLMAFFRYLGCILGPIGNIFRPIIFLLSYLWQLLGAIIYFVTSLILFIFTLIFSVFGDCDCYECSDTNADDWIDSASKPGDCAGVCEHTSKRGALCYTPCLKNIQNGEFENDDFRYRVADGNLFQCRSDTGLDVNEDVSNCQGYGFDPLPLCSAASLISQFFAVIKAFFGIFTGDIQTPDAFPSARMVHEQQRPTWKRYAGEKTQREMFSEKVQAWKQSQEYVRPEHLASTMKKRFSIEVPDDFSRNRTLMENGEAVSVPEIVFDALYGMDFRDCSINITECVCEHFHLDPNDLDCRHTDLTTVTTAQVTMAMSHMIHNAMPEGETRMATCEHLICDCENTLWVDLPYERRVEYVDCIERRAMGERMHELVPSFPADFYYRVDGPSIMAHSVLGSIKSSLHTSARKEARHMEDVKRARVSERERIETHKNYFNWRLQQRGYPKGYSSLALPYMRRLDRMERDWWNGRIPRAFERARRNIALGDWYFDNHYEAVSRLGHSSLHLTKTMARVPIKRLVLESYDALRTTGRIVSRFSGFDGSISDWITAKTVEIAKERMGSPNRKRAQKKIDQLWVGIENSPIYQWYYGPATSKNDEQPSGLTPFVNHIKRVVAHHRQHVDRVKWSFFNVDRKLYALKDQIIQRWSFTRDTPNKQANRDMLRILTESVAAKMWPESYPNHEDRFLFNSDCIVADGILQTSEKVFGYCINEFRMNYENRTARHHVRDVSDQWRDNGYHNRPNMYYPEVPEHERDLHPLKRTWRRPKVDMEAIKAKRRTRFVDLNLSHHRQWRRMIMSHPRGIFGVAQPRQSGLDSGPTAWQGRFSLVTWLICLVEDFTSTTFSMQIADFIVDVKEWLLEDNLDPTMGDVGAAYWARFLYTCDWPDSVNCSMGVGLSQAIYDVSFWFLIVFVLLSIIFPATLLPVIAFGLIAFYIIVVFVYAFRWSPRCLLLTPTFLFGWLGGIDEDVQVPGAGAIAAFSRGIATNIPVPLFAAASFPVFPMCLPDELFGLVDSWFALCGDFLEGTRWDFLLPDYMINGPRCPAMGESIDVQSCADLGMGDGLTNALYLTYWLFPTICDWVMRLGQSCYADYFPGSIVYLSAVLESFKDIPQTQMDRLTWCFWATLPSLGLVIALLLIIFTLAAIALTILAATIRLLYAAFIVLPIACCGGCRIRRSRYALEEDDDDDDDEQEIAARYHRYGREGIGSQVSGFLNRHVFRVEPKRKKE